MQVIREKKSSQPGSSIYRESLMNIVLRVLAEKPAHGYDIMKKVEEITGGKWRPAAGTLYPLLEQLHREGYTRIVEVRTEKVRGGKRIVYGLTEKGWEKLAQILVDKAEVKMQIIDYMIVQGALLLAKSGYTQEAEKICKILYAEAEKFLKTAGEACKKFIQK